MKSLENTAHAEAWARVKQRKAQIERTPYLKDKVMRSFDVATTARKAWIRHQYDFLRGRFLAKNGLTKMPGGEKRVHQLMAEAVCHARVMLQEFIDGSMFRSAPESIDHMYREDLDPRVPDFFWAMRAIWAAQWLCDSTTDWCDTRYNRHLRAISQALLLEARRGASALLRKQHQSQRAGDDAKQIDTAHKDLLWVYDANYGLTDRIDAKGVLLPKPELAATQ